MMQQPAHLSSAAGTHGELHHRVQVLESTVQFLQQQLMITQNTVQELTQQLKSLTNPQSSISSTTTSTTNPTSLPIPPRACPTEGELPLLESSSSSSTPSSVNGEIAAEEKAQIAGSKRKRVEPSTASSLTSPALASTSSVAASSSDAIIPSLPAPIVSTPAFQSQQSQPSLQLQQPPQPSQPEAGRYDDPSLIDVADPILNPHPLTMNSNSSSAPKEYLFEAGYELEDGSVIPYHDLWTYNWRYARRPQGDCSDYIEWHSRHVRNTIREVRGLPVIMDTRRYCELQSSLPDQLHQLITLKRKDLEPKHNPSESSSSISLDIQDSAANSCDGSSMVHHLEEFESHLTNLIAACCEVESQLVARNVSIGPDDLSCKPVPQLNALEFAKREKVAIEQSEGVYRQKMQMAADGGWIAIRHDNDSARLLKGTLTNPPPNLNDPPTVPIKAPPREDDNNEPPVPPGMVRRKNRIAAERPDEMCWGPSPAARVLNMVSAYSKYLAGNIVLRLRERAVDLSTFLRGQIPSTVDPDSIAASQWRQKNQSKTAMAPDSAGKIIETKSDAILLQSLEKLIERCWSVSLSVIPLGWFAE